MSRRFLLPAALLLFASACDTQSAAPEFAELPASLSLSLPQFKQLSDANDGPRQSSSVIASPAMMASMQIDGEQLPQEYEEVVARGLIAQPAQADAGFLNDANIAYGQAIGTSRGSYYRNEVDLRVSINGSQIAQSMGHESESCNCAHLFNPWGQIANTTLSVGRQCGHEASAKAQHDARLDWVGFTGRVTTLLAASGTDTHHAQQPSCPINGNSGSGGGSNGLEGEEWYICYWEDYYDSQGRFVIRIHLGCEPLNIS